MSTPVTYTVSDGVARIAMDDGKVNVMSLAMLQSLHEAFDRAARDHAMVVFSSARDGIFSASFDLKVFAAKDVAGSVAMVRAGAELALKLLQCSPGPSSVFAPDTPIRWVARPRYSALTCASARRAATRSGSTRSPSEFRFQALRSNWVEHGCTRPG